MGERHRRRDTGDPARARYSVIPFGDGRPSPPSPGTQDVVSLFVEPWTFHDPPEPEQAGVPDDLIGSYFF